MLTMYLGQVAKLVGAWFALIVVGQVLRVAIRAGSHGWKAVLSGLGIALIFWMCSTFVDGVRMRQIARDERIRQRVRGGRRW